MWLLKEKLCLHVLIINEISVLLILCALHSGDGKQNDLEGDIVGYMTTWTTTYIYLDIINWFVFSVNLGVNHILL